MAEVLLSKILPVASPTESASFRVAPKQGLAQTQPVYLICKESTISLRMIIQSPSGTKRQVSNGSLGTATKGFLTTILTHPNKNRTLQIADAWVV
jgi:hypothetical protein